MQIRIIKTGIAVIFFLSSFSAAFAENEKGKIPVRANETRSVKEVQGRIDSIRPEKIIITYEPQEQKGTQLQTYFLRDVKTKFLNREEKNIKPGDIVTVAYEESRWSDEAGKERVERIAQVVSFARTREVEELRQKSQTPATAQGISGRVSQEGPQ